MWRLEDRLINLPIWHLIGNISSIAPDAVIFNVLVQPGKVEYVTDIQLSGGEQNALQQADNDCGQLFFVSQ